MGNICSKCNEEFLEVYNYCPDCGEPLSDLAKTKEALKLQNAKLQALEELSKSTNDQNVLNAIKEYISK